MRNAPESSSDRDRQAAELLDRLALQEAAQSGARISTVSDLQRSLVASAMETRQAPSAPLGIEAKGGDGASLMEQQESTEWMETIDWNRVEFFLRKFQNERLSEVQGDIDVVIKNLPGNIAGYWDGKQIVLNINHIEAKTYLHERGHKLQGALPADLDTSMAQATGIAAIDKRLTLTPTMRDALEEDAMEYANDVPEPYRNTHWAEMKRFQMRGQSVGVDTRIATDNLIHSGDRQGMQLVVLEIAVRQVAEDGDLDTVAEQAEKSGSETAQRIVQLVDTTRRRYNEGPEGRDNRLQPSAAEEELALVA